MSFDELLLKWDAQPIRRCPGRYVLRAADSSLTPEQILGAEVEVSEHRTRAAKDTVLVAQFDGGGLISYRREDGSLLHTLNTAEGFRRKLAQLGIELSGHALRG